MVVVGGKLVPLEAFQPLIFFSYQSTIVKEGTYQKSAKCLHFYSRDATLKILKNLFSDIKGALPKYRTLQENSFFQHIDVRFQVVEP